MFSTNSKSIPLPLLLIIILLENKLPTQDLDHTKYRDNNYYE